MTIERLGTGGAAAALDFKNPVFDKQRADSAEKSSNEAFSAALAQAESALVGPERAAVKVVEGVARGAEGRIHETLMAVERADISMRLLVTVRNKVIDAYREVMQMGS